MLFCSTQFLVFFVLVFCLYWALPWHRARVWLLLGASFYFYASWNPWLALVIFASTTLDYFLARGIEASERWRWRLATISITANLGLLCYFKYCNFFLASLHDALRAAGAELSFPTLSVILPIGVSFYTFEAINYVVDVARGRVKAEKNLANFVLFILFFPHLVAGPIVRARDFLPQIRRRKRWSWERMQVGGRYFLMGLIKKLVIADRMALFVEPVFKDPGAFRCGPTWLAVFAYALQIYGDFSGYTDMAIGIAHLFDYRLARNFDMPYFAANISEFWHRWHISLSTWLRDYLFIPLGGSRGGAWRTCRNLMITMTLGGLWHGASWTFVVWGILHGVLLIGHRLFQSFCQDRPTLNAVLRSVPGTIVRIAVTFLTVSLCWVFFRAPTFATAMDVFRNLFASHGGKAEPLAAWGLFLTGIVVIVCCLIQRRGVWKWMSEKLPAPVLGIGYALMLALCLLLAPPTGQPFIYFQF